MRPTAKCLSRPRRHMDRMTSGLHCQRSANVSGVKGGGGSPDAVGAAGFEDFTVGFPQPHPWPVP